ncbi:MAG TPA: NrsF family protein [Myxococcota bacterium]|nr:NrsF family protein [Myxococcota bacterium]
MSARTAEDRIRELARDLAPVRPIPPLRWVLGAAVVLGSAAPFAAHWLLGSPGFRSGSSAVSSLPYLATFAGLWLLALGALVAALAWCVPGRESAARRGVGVAASGAAVAVVGGLWGIVAGDGPVAGASLADCLPCIGRALALGTAPVLLACAFIVYAAVRRPGSGTALALAGGVALGAVAVHVTCPSDSPMHWLLAHTLAPVVAVLLLTGPLAAFVASRTHRAQR